MYIMSMRKHRILTVRPWFRPDKLSQPILGKILPCSGKLIQVKNGTPFLSFIYLKRIIDGIFNYVQFLTMEIRTLTFDIL